LAPSFTTRVAPDMSLSRGDLRVHAESVRIDGTLDARLRAALETVMRKSGAGL
ncbi:flagellar assembly protein FliH, partial [Xanthomonas citri pv. citri]